MFARWFFSLALLGLAAIPDPVRAAADPATTIPTLVVRLRSIDGLLGDIHYVARLAGREEEAKQLEGLFKSRVGPKGLEGIDTKRPLGLYGTLEANVTESTAVVLIPISDQKAFLELLEGFNFKAKKEENGIYSVTPERLPVPIYLRFANQYVYVTAREKTALDKNKLLDPAKVLAEKPNETLSASFRIDQIPDVIKQFLSSTLEVKLAELQDQKQPGETEAHRQGRAMAAKETARQFTAFINEGSEVTLGLGINRDANDLFAELSLSGKPNSQLASSIAASARTESMFAGLQSPSSAVEIFVHGAVPENARQQLVKSADEAIHGALEKEKDANTRALVEKLYKAVLPTLKAGELDLAVELRGPTENKHYGAIAALKVKDGQTIEKVLREAQEQVPPAERERIRLDAESIGSVKVHRLDFQDQFDAQAKKVLGENPLYLAFRSDALFVVAGEGGMSLLKDALHAQPGVMPPFKFDVSVSRLVYLMEAHGGQHAGASDISRKVFGGTSKNNDKIQFVAEGGKTAKIRFDLKADVIKFFSQMHKADQGRE